MQLRHAFAPSIHRCRQQRAPVVRRGTQPPPRSKAPAPAPNRCRRQLLGRTQVRHRTRACPDRRVGPICAAGKQATPAQPKRLAGTRVRLAYHPKCGRVQHAVAQRAHAANTSRPPAVRASCAAGPAAAATLQGADSCSGSEPMLPPTAQPKRDRCLSGRRRLRAAAGVEAAPVQTGRLVRGNCGKHAAPAQSRGSSGKGYRQQTARGSGGPSMRPRIALAPPPHRCHRKRALAV
jgi:hypothetical protein